MFRPVLLSTVADISLNISNEFRPLESHEEPSEPIQEFDKQTLYIGLTTIHRVFETVLLKTKNIEIAHYYAQKAYIYYLEYMEQIRASNLSKSLHHTDVVLFVYKKTIVDLCAVEHAALSSSPSTSLHNDVVGLGFSELHELLAQLFTTVNVLLWWENERLTIADRQTLCTILLPKLLELEGGLPSTIMFHLENIQPRVDLDFMAYNELVNEFILYHKKTVSKSPRNPARTPIAQADNSQQTLQYSLYTDYIHTNCIRHNMKEFVKYIYGFAFPL
jgi:hypothetical protein